MKELITIETCTRADYYNDLYIAVITQENDNITFLQYVVKIDEYDGTETRTLHSEMSETDFINTVSDIIVLCIENSSEYYYSATYIEEKDLVKDIKIKIERQVATKIKQSILDRKKYKMQALQSDLHFIKTHINNFEIYPQDYTLYKRGNVIPCRECTIYKNECIAFTATLVEREDNIKVIIQPHEQELLRSKSAYSKKMREKYPPISFLFSKESYKKDIFNLLYKDWDDRRKTVIEEIKEYIKNNS